MVSTGLMAKNSEVEQAGLCLSLKLQLKRGYLPVKPTIVKKRNEKSYQVQAFCEERGLTPLLGVIW